MVTTKFGVFSEPNYLGHGDPYVKGALNKQQVKDLKQLPPQRDDGLNFKPSIPKQGKNNDATFVPFKPLFQGEKYIEQARQALQDKNKSKGKQVTDTPFKSTSPTKKQSGVGDFYGTLGGKIAYVEQLPQRPPPAPTKGLPNMYTNPLKKGTYGYIKTTISERKGAGGMHGEYTYKADPYDLLVQQRRQEQAVDRKARVTDAPFKPSSPAKRGKAGYTGRNVGSKAPGVLGEYTYKEEGAKAAERKGPSTLEPFKIAGDPKTGSQATLQKFPRYEADPEGLKQEAQREAKASARAKLASTNPWKYNSVKKVDMTRSIVRMNIR